MPVDTTTELEQITALLTRAADSAEDVCVALADVREFTENPDSEEIGVEGVLALLGRTQIVKRNLTFALEYSDKLAKELSDQFDLASE